MEGESILLLIFIFIILVAVIVIAILYFTYVNKYNESNIFYKNLLEIIKKDTTVDSALIKSDFDIADLDKENRKLSNILDYPNTASEEIEEEVGKQIGAAFDDDESKLSLGFDSKFNANLNSALSAAPTDLETNEKKKWTNIIGFEYDKANIYKDIIDADNSGFLYDLHNPADGDVVTADAQEYHNTINHAHILLGSADTTGTFEAPLHSIGTKHIDLLKNAEAGYSTQNGTDIPTTASDGSALLGADLNKAYLKKAFKYIANNDLQHEITTLNNSIDSGLRTKQADLSKPIGQLTTNADATISATQIDGTDVGTYNKKIIDTSDVIFCPANNKCYSMNSADGSFTPVALTSS